MRARVRKSQGMIGLLLIAGASAAVAVEVPFSSGQDIERAGEHAGVVVADIDTDGDLDVVAAQPGAGTVVWHENRRDSYFAPRVLLEIPAVEALIAADIDRNGFVDLITVTTGGSAALHLAEPDPFAPSPGFDSRAAFSTSLTAVSALAIARFGVGGTPELIVARAGTPALQRFAYDPAQADRFGTPSALPLPTGTTGLGSVATADIDRDGFLDVVASGRRDFAGLTTATLFWIRRTGPTTFGSAIEIDAETAFAGVPIASYPALALADFDRDGDVDLAYLRNESDANASAGVYLRENVDGAFATGAANRREIDILPAGVTFQALAAGDVDRDGDPDLAIEDDRPSGPSVMQRFDNGSWNERPSGTGEAAAATKIFVHDDDIDGDPDLVVARVDGGIERFENRRIHGRAFVPAVRTASISSAAYGAFSGPADIAPTLLRRTGRPMVLFTEFFAGRVGLASFVRSGGTIQPAIATSPVAANVGGARALSVADLDHDGDEDFLLGTGELTTATPANQNRLVLGLNDDAGYVPSITGCQNGDDIRGVALARLGFGTGIQGTGFDIVYSSFDTDRVAIHADDCADEIVLTDIEDSALNGPAAVQVADLDGNGVGDVALAIGEAPSPGVLGNAIGFFPNSRFDDLEEMETVRGATDVVAFDTNRDGRPDLATASQGDPATDPLAGRVILLRNQGIASVDPVVAATGIHAPGRIAFSDIDHDGDNDLFLTSESNRSIPPNRTQCGVFLIEAEGANVFAAPRCLDASPSMQGAYTRLALADLDRDGVDDVVATSTPANRLGFFVSDAIIQAFSDHFRQENAIALTTGRELCPRFVDVDHLGRAGDSDLIVAEYRIEMSAADAAGVVEALILRRDDGDGVPEPDADVELARDASPAGADFEWQLTVPPTTAAARIRTLETSRYWLCVKARSPLPATSQSIKLLRPEIDLRDADAGIRAVQSGFIPNNTTGTTITTAALFGDGFEDE